MTPDFAWRSSQEPTEKVGYVFWMVNRILFERTIQAEGIAQTNVQC